MSIDSMTDLCSAIIEFQEMLEWDCDVCQRHKKTEQALLISNQIDEFSEIFKFAEKTLDKAK